LNVFGGQKAAQCYAVNVESIPDGTITSFIGAQLATQAVPAELIV